MKRFAMVFTALVVLSGCATQPPFKPMPESAAKIIKSADVVTGTSQKEIIPEIIRSNMAASMGGGLVWALMDVSINNARTKSAEAAVAPVRNALVDYDLGAAFKTALESEAKTVVWMADSKVDLSPSWVTTNLEKSYSDTRKDALLTVAFNYLMSPDFKTVRLVAHANLFPKSEDLKKIQSGIYKDTTKINSNNDSKVDVNNSLYRQQIEYRISLPSGSRDMDAAAKAWAQDNGAKLKAALAEGVQVIARLVSMGLSQPVAFTADGKHSPMSDVVVEINNKKYVAIRDGAGGLGIDAN